MIHSEIVVCSASVGDSMMAVAQLTQKLEVHTIRLPTSVRSTPASCVIRPYMGCCALLLDSREC